MENQSNNLIPELADFRAELATFKQRLDDQQIVNDRLLRRSMKSRISPFITSSVVGDALGLLFSPVIFVALNRFGIHWTLGAVIVLMIILELLFNIYNYCRISRLFTRPTDLVTMRRDLLRFRHGERLWMIIGVPTGLILVAFLWWRMGAFSQFHIGLVFGIIGLVLGLATCFAVYRWEMRRVSQVERELDELSDKT